MCVLSSSIAVTYIEIYCNSRYKAVSTVTAPQPNAGTTSHATSRSASLLPWLLLVHQLPSSPSNLRVRTWRRLQQLGALPLKQALYVLPDSPAAREDFEWLKTEIEGAGGQATVFSASAVDAWSNDALVDEFRRTREESYDGVARDAEKLLKRYAGRTKAVLPRRAVPQLRERLAVIEQVDFFGSAGRDRVVTLIRQLESRGRGPAASHGGGANSPIVKEYRGRLWVTRPRPGVDRIASAWLIRRFIDAQARFAFVGERDVMPAEAVPFDMFGVEFTHRGEHCTFETFCSVFQLDDPALAKIAGIVHDLDLKDERFGAPEAASIGLLIEGLRLTHSDDEALLAAGIAMFEALYFAIMQASRPQGPRPVARRRKRAQPARGRQQSR
jgi:hypothetical protein